MKFKRTKNHRLTLKIEKVVCSHLALDLLQILNQEYDISATALQPIGPIWKVKSAKGFFALKRTHTPAKKLERIFKILSQINQAGFLPLIPPELSLKKLPYFGFNNHNYQLFQWCQGNHPSFTVPDAIQKSARLFAGLHRISIETLELEDYKTPDFTACLEQKANFIETTILSLGEKPQLNHVDRTLLSWSEYFLTQARFALSGLRQTIPVLKPEATFGFCHNDPAPRNIIVDDGRLFLIDFELSDCDWFVFELAKLIGRVLQVNDWRLPIFDLVSDAYARERDLTDWERAVLPYLLCFPQHFWRICSQRFEEKLKWSERRFAARLWKIIDTEKQRLTFLKTILPQLPIFERSKVVNIGLNNTER